MSYYRLPSENRRAPPSAATTDGKTTSRHVVAIIVLACLASAIVVIMTQIHILRLIGIVSYPEFEIDSFSGTGVNFSSSPDQISGVWNIGIGVNNNSSNTCDQPQIVLKFSAVKISVFRGDELIIQTSLQPFELGPTNLRAHRTMKFTGSSGIVQDSTWSDVSSGILADGKVRFDVKLESLVTIMRRWDFFKNKKCKLMAYCNDVEVFLSEDAMEGMMLIGSKKCEVELEKVCP